MLRPTLRALLVDREIRLIRMQIHVMLTLLYFTSYLYFGLPAVVTYLQGKYFTVPKITILKSYKKKLLVG